MSSLPIGTDDEMALAENLPQADASSLVDREVLEAQVQDMYRQVAREEEAQLHFAVGRQLALRVGYPSDLLDAIPAEALPVLDRVFRHACAEGLIDELGNGRFARSLFERACACRDLRVAHLGEAATASMLTTVTAADLRSAYDELAGG